MRRALLIGLGVFALAMTWTFDRAQAGGKKSDSVVAIKPRLEKTAAGKSVVVFSLDIQKGWHLYANPVNHDFFEGGQVVVKALGTDAKITYPPGTTRVDKKLGKYDVYEKKVEIRATFDRVVDAANPVEFTIKLQSCDDDVCLVPATVKLTVP